MGTLLHDCKKVEYPVITWKGVIDYQSRKIPINGKFIGLIIEKYYGDYNPLDFDKKLNSNIARGAKTLREELAYAEPNSFISALNDSLLDGLGGASIRFYDILRECFPDQMTRDLIIKGYLTSDFRLLSSTFVEGTNTVRAQNFITMYLEKDATAYGIYLDEESANYVVQKYVDNLLLQNSKAAYNEHFFVALFRKSNAKILAHNLVSRLTEETIRGDIACNFILHIAELIPNESNSDVKSHARDALRFIFNHQPQAISLFLEGFQDSDPGPTEDVARELLSAAMLVIPSMNPFEDKKSVRFLRDNYELVLGEGQQPVSEIVSQLDEIVSFLRDHELSDFNLQKIDSSMRKQFFDNGLFSIDADNLELARGYLGKDPTLSSLFDYKPSTVFDHVLNYLPDYLQTIEGIEVHSFDDSKNAFEIIKKIDKLDDSEELIQQATELSSGSYQFGSIQDLSRATQKILVSKGWVESTVSIFNSLHAELTGDDEQQESLFQEDDLVQILKSSDCISGSASELDAKTIVQFILENDIDSYVYPQSNEKGSYLSRIRSLEAKNPGILASISFGWKHIGSLTPDKVRTVIREGFLDNGKESYSDLKEIDDNPDLCVAFMSEAKSTEWVDRSDITSSDEAIALLESDEVPRDLRENLGDWIADDDIAIDPQYWMRVIKQFDSLGLVFPRSKLKSVVESIETPRPWHEMRLIIRQLLDDAVDASNREEFASVLRAIGGNYAKILSLGSRPKFENDPLNYRLGKIVKQEFGTVSSFSPLEYNPEYKGKMQMNLKTK